MSSYRKPLRQLLPTIASLWLLSVLVACDGGREAATPSPSAQTLPPASVGAEDPYAEARTLYAARAERVARAEVGR